MSHQHATKANIINQQGFHYTDRTNSQHASALISCLANLSSQCNISMQYNIITLMMTHCCVYLWLNLSIFPWWPQDGHFHYHSFPASFSTWQGCNSATYLDGAFWSVSFCVSATQIWNMLPSHLKDMCVNHELLSLGSLCTFTHRRCIWELGSGGATQVTQLLNLIDWLIHLCQ